MSRMPFQQNRRELLRALAAGALALPLTRSFAADKLTVGVIYVGPKDDYGYNQAQARPQPR